MRCVWVKTRQGVFLIHENWMKTDYWRRISLAAAVSTEYSRTRDTIKIIIK